ncbi:hypothetical protein N9V90_01985 [Endozoicomonas sp.]|nr:hypothetical protein [Endozoicomonas sp.]
MILGAGGHARVLADTALTTKQWDSVAFLDDQYPELSSMNGWPVIGRISEAASYVEEYPEMALGLGVEHDSLRLKLLVAISQAGARFPAIIHPAATVSALATVREGSVVFAGSVININTRVGTACIINTHASIDHDC